MIPDSPVKKPSKKGFTLVEVLVGIGIFALISTGLFSVFNSAYRSIGISKARRIATHLATEQMEKLKNVSYQNVGTQGGWPSGVALQQETITREGINFTIDIDIRQVDDPYDGQGLDDQNGEPWDYSQARIEISWDKFPCFRPTVLTTFIVPKNIESNPNGGFLSVQVVDSNGNPVPSAIVHIVNSSEVIDINTRTDNYGFLKYSSLPEGYAAYEMTVTKEEYSESKTYPTTIENPNPDPPHATVLVDQLTETSFAIDKVSTLTANVQDAEGSPLPNVSLLVRGTKTIGKDNDGNPIYKYNEIHNTNGEGILTLTSMEWDSYIIKPQGESGYDLAESIPSQPVDVLADTSTVVTLKLAPHQENTLLITVKDESTGNPIQGASVRLYKTGYDEQKISGQSGQAFFSPLTIDSYSLEVSFTGYLTSTSSIDILGQTEEGILLTPTT
ncbi:hypothetical protein COY23_03890 [bacterium (Candidatus Torokbacteria) CG_4_10_14_0_2_um_filter_35_8]|nr:MAG: hypothetical protein COY23_03890 [bacterium (Candidatus Torokbacteria) CG_4_10_14_0_2_um_filter_35_8]